MSLKHDAERLHLHEDPQDRRAGGYAPFSEEQIEYLEASRRSSVNRAIRHYRNQAIAGFTLLLLGLLVALGLQERDLSSRRALAVQQRHAIVESGRAVAVNSCNARYEDRLQIRGVLISSRNSVKRLEKEGVLSHQRAQDSLDFYADQLKKLTLPDCRKDAGLLTDDPDKPVPQITPLYPNSPQAPSQGSCVAPTVRDSSC